MWVVHPVLCENVIVENITVDSHGPNNDGCNPESCTDVLIQNCNFDTGDDCIALKSGRNQDGRRIAQPTENVIIRNCRMKDGHGGVVIGSEVSGGCRNIFAEDCEMDSPNLDRAIRVKTNRSRGGVIENLHFRSINVGQVKEAVVKVNMLYTLDDSISVNYPVVRNIYVENVTSKSSKYGVRILGLDEEHQVSSVHLKNCVFSGVESGNDIQLIEELTVDNVLINGEQWNK
jgi:polygalacturonase